MRGVFRKVRSSPLSSMTAEELVQHVQNPVNQQEKDEAVEELLRRYTPIIQRMAREQYARWAGARTPQTMSLEDLVQEGVLGLLEAAKAFKLVGRRTFSVYANRAIRDRIRTRATAPSLYHLPPSWVRVSRVAAGVHQELAQELNRDPTMDELRARIFQRCMDWALTRLPETAQHHPRAVRERLAVAKLRKQGLFAAVTNLEAVLAATGKPLSLQGMVGQDGSDEHQPLEAVLASPDQDRADQVLSALRDQLDRLFDQLEPKQAEVLRLRYGFVDGHARSYTTIAAEVGMSPERVRQIDRVARARLKELCPELRDWLDSFQ